MQSPFSSAPIVDELWNGLEDNEFYATDGRRWRQHPHPELTLEERLLISFRKQIPPEHSKNVRLVTKGKAAAFLYALSSADQHFWGISASVISRLFKQRTPTYQTKAEVAWAVVLLDGSWRTGYWFDSARHSIGLLVLVSFGFANTIARADSIYVSDYGSGEVEKFDFSGNGSAFAGVPPIGPTGLAFDSSANLYVANYNAGTIEKFDSSGNGSVFASGLDEPRFLAFDRNGDLYVTSAAGLGRKLRSTS